MSALVQWLLDLLYPPKCMFCRKLMHDSEKLYCGRCILELPEYDGAEPKVQFYDHCVAPFYYKAPVRESILRFKFGGRSDYAAQYAQWIAIWVRDRLSDKFDLISWVPCSARRRWIRGYDQAELLACALAKELDTPCVQTLVKVRDNKAQSRIGGAARRRANVSGAYRAVNQASYAGKRILVVDDVITTGATISECGRVLRTEGAAGLLCAAVAVAGHDNDE